MIWEDRPRCLREELERIRKHCVALRETAYPGSQERMTHCPPLQPTPAECEICVQSLPSPVEAQPPHESRDVVVSRHSYPPAECPYSMFLLDERRKAPKLAEPAMGQAVSPTGHRDSVACVRFFALALAEP